MKRIHTTTIMEIKGVVVSDSWLDYNVFNEWYKQQVALNTAYDESWEVDKDILTKGKCREYSEKSCLLVPRSVNQIFKYGKANNIKTLSNRKKKCVELMSQFEGKISKSLEGCLIGFINGEYDRLILNGL